MCVCVCVRAIRLFVLSSFTVRGPFSIPTEGEKIEYSLTRTPKAQTRTSFADHALEHTLSYQRRVLSIKTEFLRRCHPTPLGICQDFWDRTEDGVSVQCVRVRRLRVPS